VTDNVMMETARGLAKKTGARAIVSFLKPFEFKSEIPVIWVEDLQLDVLKDLTMLSHRTLRKERLSVYSHMPFSSMISGKVRTSLVYGSLTVLSQGR